MTDACTELHCAEEHGDTITWRDHIHTALVDLVDAYHATHSTDGIWSLCNRDACRETAIALGVRV